MQGEGITHDFTQKTFAWIERKWGREKKNKTKENSLVVIGRFASTVIVIENNHSRWKKLVVITI